MTISASRPRRNNAMATFKDTLMTGRVRGIIAGGFMVAILGLGLACDKPDPPASKTDAPVAVAGGTSDHLMFGGTVSRNMVNLKDTNIPAQLLPQKEKDDDGKDKVVKEAEAAVLWQVPLGSKAYGGPVIANGKVFVGTNNQNPRNKRDIITTA